MLLQSKHTQNGFYFNDFKVTSPMFWIFLQGRRCVAKYTCEAGPATEKRSNNPTCFLAPVAMATAGNDRGIFFRALPFSA